jgi:phosphoenolpyruvate carboxylase
MLPAWLGSETALNEFIKSGRLKDLQSMTEQWPFFQTYIDMLEMVLSKADKGIARYYENTLYQGGQSELGQDLRDRLEQAIKLVLEIKQQSELLEHSPTIGQSMAVRNPYTDPLHYLQAELMRRTRSNPDNHSLEHALKVTMAGIAAGMRNTG